MKTGQSILPLSLKPLFWSYDFSKLDPRQNIRLIIINIINYGNWEHWQWLINFYGEDKVIRIIEETPRSEFRRPALKLISLLLGVKKQRYASRSDYIRSQKNL